MRPSDILRNPFKERLARGEVVSSMTVRLVRGIEIARIAKTAGFDALYVDLEHSPMDARNALDMGISDTARRVKVVMTVLEGATRWFGPDFSPHSVETGAEQAVLICRQILALPIG